jgi:hypothetical protein
MGEIITTTATCFELHFWLGLGFVFLQVQANTQFLYLRNKTNKQTNEV